jgi:hypothetical protein
MVTHLPADPPRFCPKLCQPEPCQTGGSCCSSNRLLSIDDGNVRFRWKDYRNGNYLGAMTRRFLLHVMPEGFQRIRYYGFLCNRYREQKLVHCCELLGMEIEPPEAREQSEFDAHKLAALFVSPVCRCRAGGLVQSVFSSPARPRSWVLFRVVLCAAPPS